MSTIPPAAFRRVVRELTEMQKNPPEGIRIQTSEDNMLDVVGLIEGPEGTPYAGGYFRVKFKFTEEFPAAPPKCWFATKIFHPNVSSSGEICVNTLKKDWKSTYGIQHILVTVKCLLIYPNPESALDEEAGKLLLEDYDSYCQRAKLITSVHARTRPKEFDIPSAKEESEPNKAAAPASTTITPPPPANNNFTLPITNTNAAARKPSSPGPAQPHHQSHQHQPLTPSSPSNKDSSTLSAAAPNKERHTSPSPLATADANVSKPSPAAVNSANNNLAAGATKAVKRAATATPAAGGEKRKKALKRL